MPAHELPGQDRPPDPLRHMPQRTPGRPYWGPPIIPGVGASWESEGSGGLPAERNIGRIRQIVLTAMIGVVLLSLVGAAIYYWAGGGDADNQAGARPEAGASAQVSGPSEPTGADQSRPPGGAAQATTEIIESANQFYTQARAGQFELIMSQSCDDVAGGGTADGVAALTDRYDTLLAWTLEDVDPAGASDTAVVSASLRFSGQGSTESEESLLFIDEGGWRYCGSG